MSSPVQDLVTVRPVVYLVTADDIAATKAKYAALDATTAAGYEEVRLAIATVRSTRVSIEKRRVDLKAEALDYGRRVDAEAKRLTAMIEEIEEPLVAKKKAIDDEKARIKAEAEAAKLKVLQDQLAAERAVEEARLRAEREAESARLATEREALERERAELAEQRRVADEQAAEERAAEEERQRIAREAEQKRNAEEAERLRIEREQLAEERRAIDAAKAKAQAEADAQAKLDADRLAAAEREALIQSLLPDAKKLNAFAAALRAVPVPAVKTKAARAALDRALTALDSVAASLTSIESRVA